MESKQYGLLDHLVPAIHGSEKPGTCGAVIWVWSEDFSQSVLILRNTASYVRLALAIHLPLLATAKRCSIDNGLMLINILLICCNLWNIGCEKSGKEDERFVYALKFAMTVQFKVTV